ncbi:MAG: hypothetical protein ACKO8I_06535, partial [Cyanobacteriota bacterium]
MLLRLERTGEGGWAVEARVGGEGRFAGAHAEVPSAVREGRAAFLQGIGAGTRQRASAGRARIDSELLALGQALAAFCLPGGAAEALARL